MRSALAVVLCALALGLVTEPASAEPPFVGACGRVNAFTPATATASGSIAIGPAVFAVLPSDRPMAATVGELVCIRRNVTTSGPVLELFPMLTVVCGALVPELAVAPRIVVATAPPLGTLLSFERAPEASAPNVAPGSTVCFRTIVDAAGAAVLAAIVTTIPAASPEPSGAPARIVTTLPSTSTR